MAKNPTENRAFKKPRASRCPELTLELINKISNAIRLGNYIDVSVALYGVPRWKYYEWMETASCTDNPESLERILADTVDVALAEADVRDIQRIDNAAEGRDAQFLRDENGKIHFNDKGDPIIVTPPMNPQWAAAAWKLERRNSRRYGRTDRLEHSGADGGPIKTQQMTKEELEAEMKQLESILNDEYSKPEPEKTVKGT